MEVEERWTHLVEGTIFVVDLVYFEETKEYLVRHMIGSGPEIVMYHGTDKEAARTNYRYAIKCLCYN